MNHKIKIIERYIPKYSEYKYKTGISYKDILEIVDTIYILNIDGKDNDRQYKTKEEAEQAIIRYNKEDHLKNLQKKADKKLQELINFRSRLYHLNSIYSVWKREKCYEIGKEFISGFKENNPVIDLLSQQEQQRCYMVLMKNILKGRISEYYKIKKEYLKIKKEIKRLKNIG